ncbi:MAG TPA: ABC transporter substrate-binding protein [Streptosporangiaceae bacterium]
MRVIRLVAGAAAGLTLALGAAACTSSTSSGGGGANAESTAAPTHGGTITIQWPATPNFIFPLMPATNTDGYNENLQLQMWPYLVDTGYGSQSSVNPKESLYSSMTWSNNDQSITVVLKPWKWSDGKPMTSRDFLFTYNLLKSMGQNWIGYLPGLFPVDVKSVTTPSSSTFVINLTRSYNPDFYTDDVLNQVPLLPQHAWDKESVTGATGNYDETAKGAAAVVSFLQKQGSQMSTFASNPLWQVVDGPWKLSQFTTSGNYTYVPNTSYSGPDKPYLSKIINAGYTTEDSAYTALRAGGDITGQVPADDVKQFPELEAEGFRIVKQVIPGFAAISLNFYAPNGVAAIFSQLYIRQAMEDLINRPELVQETDAGFGDPGNGPVPTLAYPNLDSSAEQGKGMYPYSPSTAIGLLKSHGWAVHPNGVTTCASPGTGGSDCGAGIASGARLAFTLDYSSGDPEFDEQQAAIATWWAQAGMKLTLKSEPFNTLVATVGACSASSHPTSTCSWQLYDQGYIPYGLDPVGSGNFNTGGPNNYGGYSSPQMDQLINQTEYGSGSQAFTSYENFATAQLPQLWLPLGGFFTAIPSSLQGFTPLNPFSGGLNPDVWYYSKS